MNETHAILQRMRELAVQAANDTNTDVDRAELQEEIVQLNDEIDRIANNTEFNTKKLLNGGVTVKIDKTGTSATVSESSIAVLGGSVDPKIYAVVKVPNATMAKAAAAAAKGNLSANDAMTDGSRITINGVTFSFNDTDTVQDALDAINSAGIGVTASLNDVGNFEIKSNIVGSKSVLDVKDATGTFTLVTDPQGNTVTPGYDAVLFGLVDDNDTILSYTADANIITITSGEAKGLQFEIKNTVYGDADNYLTLTVTGNGGLNMHIGANENQTMYVSIGDMRAASLGVIGVDVTTTIGAESAISAIQKAIESVSAERARLGAYQNRLEHTINNLSTSAENLTAAESRIRDVDMAKEMMEFTKNNILQQAAQAMLAQANQLPQGVLQLLR